MIKEKPDGLLRFVVFVKNFGDDPDEDPKTDRVKRMAGICQDSHHCNREDGIAEGNHAIRRQGEA